MKGVPALHGVHNMQWKTTYGLVLHACRVCPHPLSAPAVQLGAAMQREMWSPGINKTAARTQLHSDSGFSPGSGHTDDKSDGRVSDGDEEDEDGSPTDQEGASGGGTKKQGHGRAKGSRRKAAVDGEGEGGGAGLLRDQDLCLDLRGELYRLQTWPLAGTVGVLKIGAGGTRRAGT